MAKGIKLKIWHIAAIALILFVLVFALMQSGMLSLNMSGNGGNGGNGNNVPAGKASVTRPITFTASDFFNGTQGSGTLTIFKSGADQASETLTLSSGSVTSSKAYTSGEMLDILYNDGSDSKLWINGVVVPTMSSADVQSQANNRISVDSFTHGTYTSDSLTQGATAVSDGDSYNNTLTGDTPTFSYKLTNTGDDNTGLMESSDPTTGYKWDVYVLVKFSGTGAETISISDAGFDNTLTVGTSQYGWIHLNPNALTIWKDSVGAYKTNDGTKCTGIQSIDFSPDLTGYVGTAVTMQITAYAYFDPTYLENHNGAVQSSAYQIAEQTVTLTN